MDSTLLTPVTLDSSKWTSIQLNPAVISFDMPVHWSKVYEYVPQKDIAAYEVSLLMNIFYPTAFIDNVKYINDNGLIRHFKVRP